MELVNGIGFDLDHTLAIDNRLERVAFLRLLEAILAEGGRAIGTLTNEIENIDDLLANQRRGDFSIDEAVRRFVAAHAVAPTETHVDWFRRTAVAMVDDFVVPLPGVEPTLRALSARGIATAVLTNGWNPLQLRKAERAGFRGTILVSSEIGVQKPAVAAFDALVHVLGTQARETLYVGDDPRGDIAGASDAGLQSAWIDWEEKKYPPELRAPDYTIHSFEELLGVLPERVRTP